MDERWAQDVLRCHLCDISGPTMYCDICQIHLCKECVGEHLSSEFKDHKVVPYKMRGSTVKCQKHSSKICELHCVQCDIPICATCVSLEDHKDHGIVEFLKHIENKKEAIRRDLTEFELSIYPKYKEIASYISVQKGNINTNSEKLTTALDKQKEDLQKEIDDILRKLKSALDKIDSRYLAVLNRQEDEIAQTISKITQNIDNLNILLNSNDASLVSAYKSMNAEFRSLPPKLTISLPSLTSQKINKEQLYQQFGSLSAFCITSDDSGYTIDSPDAETLPSERSLLDESRIITEIKTEYGDNNELYSVSCLSDDYIWTCGNEKIMKLVSLQGKLVKEIETNSRTRPGDITVTNGYLVYTDYNERAVNILKNKKLNRVARLQGWRPRSVCISSTGDFLVVIDSDDYQQVKIVRYSSSDFKEKQCIQSNDNGEPLYSLGDFSKYISENKNLDICVADYGAAAVVVVNQAGKLRFTYTGPSSTIKESFCPVGITTDSQSRILTADYWNNRIHIFEQDGQFLRCIDDCDIQRPWGLCVDSKDNLFVAECKTRKVKKIQYYV
ncbi:tripartite motif-containing protein 2 [Magallana gigas]|uniref:tripartite motif-containing protein 2 n=1 Tax=Magallana gigas TaxID=29159 RepID=UPI00333E62AF